MILFFIFKGGGGGGGVHRQKSQHHDILDSFHINFIFSLISQPQQGIQNIDLILSYNFYLTQINLELSHCS